MNHNKRFYLIIGVVLLVGFLLRLAFVLSLPNRALDPDEPDYVISALDIIQDGSFDKAVYYHVPPVAPMLFSGVVGVTGISYVAPRVFQCFLFLAIAWVAYFLGRQLGGELAGFVTLVLVSIYPYFIYFTGYAMTETTATLVIPLTLLIGVKCATKPSLRLALLFGILLSVSALTRSASYLFVLAVPLVFLIAVGFRNTAWLKLTFITILGFMMLYVPWGFVNYRHFGRVIPSPTIGSGVMLYQTGLRITMPDPEKRQDYFSEEIKPRYYYPPGGDDKDRLAGDEDLGREGKRMIMENIGKYPSIFWSNFKRFWQFYPHAPQEQGKSRALAYKILGLGSYGILFPFLLVGGVVGLRRFRHLAVLYGFIVYYTLVHSLLYGKLRYRIPLDPLLIAFAAVGLLWLLKSYRPKLFAGFSDFVGCRESPLDLGDQ